MRHLSISLVLLTASLLAAHEPATAKEVVILYTNDIESVYEPVEAYWRDDIRRMGGIPHLANLIREIRSGEPRTVLVDAGDLFTGSLSKATGGRLVFDIYSEMDYDAVNLGNHEFEYGWQLLREVMQRARFPVLNANIFFENTSIPFAREYAILKVDDVRVGVIGAMGVDAFVNTMMPANRQGLFVRPPAEILQPIVDLIRPEVDLLLLLTHQNRTAPMQTNKESDPEVQRGIDEDYALAGRLQGVDMIIGGHSDNGLAVPVRHPATGTLIGMTYGQGMHLGYAKFDLGETGKEVRLVDSRLIPVDADQHPADPAISSMIREARAAHPALTRVVARLDSEAARRYYRESTLGNLLADLLREYTGADIGYIPAGALRADLRQGEVTVEEVLNVFPFTDTVSVITVSGAVLREVFEKSLSLEYGLGQVGGATLRYDGSAPAGSRLRDIQVGGAPLEDGKSYQFATVSFTATGGENYSMFEGLPMSISDVLVADALIQQMTLRGSIELPRNGRQVDLAVKGK